jgi:hypothetical protein
LQSQAVKLPNLSASASQSWVNTNNANPVVGGFQTQANFLSSYDVSSSFTLYNGGYIRNDIKVKELSVQSANSIRKGTVFVGDHEFPVGDTYKDVTNQLTGSGFL